jgi:hypothetical protein
MRVLTVLLAVLWFQPSGACACSPESLIIGPSQVTGMFVPATEAGSSGVVATLRGR